MHTVTMDDVRAALLPRPRARIRTISATCSSSRVRAAWRARR